MNSVMCDLCPRQCELDLGQTGFCGVRRNEAGKIVSLSYGKVSSLALDPIEKKPLSFYKPGSWILSVGSFGCNMACSFCQNHEIARSTFESSFTEEISAEQLIEIAKKTRKQGNVGIAFTYNEPLINYEYIVETAKIAQAQGLDVVLVTNGQINARYLDSLLPLVDAWNIDLKSFSKEAYRKLGGDRDTTLNTIKRSQAVSHVEVTTLVVPGISDDEDLFLEEVQFLASLNPEIPLHLSRYFPQYRFDQPATDIPLMLHLKSLADKVLKYVILGNV